MKKRAVLCFIIIVVTCFVASSCGEQKLEDTPDLPPGFQEVRVPNVQLDGFLYVSQGSPFVLPGEENFPSMEHLSVCLVPIAEAEALWGRASFSFASQADSADRLLADVQDIWKFRQERELFNIYFEGLTAEPLVKATTQLVKATTQNDLVLFKSTYPDLWVTISRLPANPPSKAVGAGFVRPSDNFNNWLKRTIGDEQLTAIFSEVVDKARIKHIVVGLYSRTDLNRIDEDTLDEAGLSVLLVGKSSYPGFVISIIGQVISGSDMTEEYVDGDKVYGMRIDDAYIVVSNVGSYIYFSIALNHEEAKNLLRSVLAEPSTVSPPVTEPTIAWGKCVSSQFKSKVIEISRRLGVDVNHLMAAMAFETGGTFDPSVTNPVSGAIGLIQFLPSTAQSLGTTAEALRDMSAVDQLDYVEKYFEPYRGKLTTLEDVYMAILWPRAISQPLDYTLFAQPSTAYNQNRGLDLNGDGRITKAEASAKVRDSLAEGLSPHNKG